MAAKKNTKKLMENTPDGSFTSVTADELRAATTPEEKSAVRVRFYSDMLAKLESFKGADRDKYLARIDPLLNEDLRNQLWQRDQAELTRTISRMMQALGRMPCLEEIANECDLSKEAIRKHLAEYANHPMYTEQVKQFQLMTSKVLTTTFQYAMNGDMQAAELYMKAVGNLNGQTPGNTHIQNQHNYVQINGTVLSQDKLKQLSPDQLNAIEAILKTALEMPEAH